MHSIMILGGDGLIGSALSKFLKQNNHHVVTTTRNKKLLNSSTYYLNFKTLEGLSLLPMVDIVFICAAISTKKESVQNKELALQVNVLAPKIITDFFISNNARVIFLSSSAIFHGVSKICNEMDNANPITDYGKLKVAAENKLLNENSQYIKKLVIVRPTKIFSKLSPLIVDWTEKLNNNLQIQAYENVLISPVSINFLVESLTTIAFSDSFGIFHISGKSEYSFYDFAIMLAKKLKADIRLVEKILLFDPNDMPPQHALLSMDRSANLLGIKPQSTEKLLKDLFNC